MKSYNILNNLLTVIYPEEIKELLLEWLNNSEESNFIITFNLDNLRLSQIDKKFFEITKKAKYIFIDGIGVSILLRLKYGIKFPRMNGNDLLKIILELSSIRKYKLALLGASESTLKKVDEKIGDQFSGIEVVYSYSPPYGFESDVNENCKIVKELSLQKPDILLVALGCPKQELWIGRYKDDIKAKINFGLGAALDFYSGTKKRSPLLFRKIGMEWMWRLFQEPGRLFTRYIIKDIPFFIKTSFKIIFKIEE